jgi:hypothetical protein
LTAVDVDRASPTSVRSPSRGSTAGRYSRSRRRPSGSPKPSATRRQRGAAHANPAADTEFHPSASRSHRSVGPQTFAKTGRLVVESAMFPNERIMCRPGFGSSSSSLLRWPSLATLAGDAFPGSRAPANLVSLVVRRTLLGVGPEHVGPADGRLAAEG